MAQIQYTGLVSGMQGKLNGSVLSRGRSGNVIYKKPVQRLAPTQAQLAVRAGFSSAATAWGTLSDTERDDWATISAENPLPDRFGVPRIISGYAYFKRMMALAFPTLGGSPLIPNLTGDAAYEFTPGTFGAEMTLTDQGYKVNFAVLDAETINDSPVANQWNVYISLPVHQANFPYFRTWYFVASSFFADNLGVGVPIDFSMGNKFLPSGFRTFEGALHLWKAVTFIPGQGSVSVEQIWSGVAAWVGPDVFPLVDPWNVGPSGIHPRWRPDTTRIVGNMAMIIGDGTVDYDGIYTVKLKVAPIQAGTSQPAEISFVDENAFTLLYDSGTNLHQLQTGSPYTNMFAWLGFAYGTAVPDSEGLYIPIRLVFVDIATAAESPPRYEYWQIFEYP